MIVTLALSGLCLQTLAGAQENGQRQPTYTDAAAAGHAAHMAQSQANTTDPSLQAALMQLNEAEVQMGKTEDVR